MSSKKQITVEEVDRLIAQAEAKPSRAKSTKGVSKAQLNLSSICGIVNKAVPILRFAKTFLWWKPKWVKIIDDVIAISSMACGVPE